MVSDTLKADIINYVSANYPEQYTDLKGMLDHRIRLKTVAGKSISSSISKFGGLPNVSGDFVWPNFNGAPLSFLFQLNFEEISSFNLTASVPAKGMLYFFILTEKNNGFPEAPNEYKVVFDKNFSKESSKKYFSEESIPIKFNECFVQFYSSYCLPSYQDYEVLKIEEEKDWSLYSIIEDINCFINEVTEFEDFPEHQLFGKAQAIQGTVNFHWAKNLLSFSYPFSNIQLSSIQAKESKLRLLLQVDFSDKKLGLQNNLDGIAYFGIHEDALLDNDFDKSLLICQNT